MSDCVITTLENVLRLLRDYRTDCDLLGFTCNANEVQEVEEEFAKFIEQQKLGRNPDFICLMRPDGHIRSETEVDREYILRALSFYESKMETSRRIEISRSRLFLRIKQYKISNIEINYARR